MTTKDFYYDLPQELIAQDPLSDRSSSRLMVVDRKTGEIEHRIFKDITEFLQPGDVLVRNNTRVIPARLLGSKLHEGEVKGMSAGQSPAAVEVFLLKRLEDELSKWECIVRPGKKLREGAKVTFGDGLLTGEITKVLPDGNRIVQFTYEGIFEEILDKLGQMPLPPYITHELKDKDRYQTVYAKYDGSAAAPTAGLHFTKELFAEIEKMGVQVANVTLHVGLGTFRPVKVDNVENHVMHSEYYEVRKEDADIINLAKKEGRRVIAVGTTSTRTLESVADENGYVRECSGNTQIFIYPGYKFKCIDGLITNFHLPESTLLMLVSAFSSKDIMFNAYEEAIKEKYRFFSFGDAMFLH